MDPEIIRPKPNFFERTHSSEKGAAEALVEEFWSDLCNGKVFTEEFISLLTTHARPLIIFKLTDPTEAISSDLVTLKKMSQPTHLISRILGVAEVRSEYYLKLLNHIEQKAKKPTEHKMSQFTFYNKKKSNAEILMKSKLEDNFDELSNQTVEIII